MKQPENYRHQDVLGRSKAEVEKFLLEAETPPMLASRSIPRDEFSLIATCGPEFVSEYLGTPDLVPVDGDNYSTMDALIGVIAAMSMRYGLYNPDKVLEVCEFLKKHTLDELNVELQAGRSFVFTPANKEPRFVDQELSLVNLHQLCGDHIYPGFVLDVAAAVAVVNARIRN